MSALSEWLQLMLAEIARKQDDLERARTEEGLRASEKGAAAPRRTSAEARTVGKLSTRTDR
jgi:hypothetical protein